MSNANTAAEPEQFRLLEPPRPRKKGLTTVFSYPDRGPYGNNSYKGNCSGYIIRDLLMFFEPKKVADYMEGSGTCGDVCRDLEIPYVGLDLNKGFDLMSMDIPEGADFVFLHPPYLDIYKYSKDVWGNGAADPRDISMISDWREFINALNKCLTRSYTALRTGGHMAVLVGDVIRKGQCFSMVDEMVKLGKHVRTCMKIQHNVTSENRVYGTPIIRVAHEYVYITQKDDPNMVWAMVSKVERIDLRKYNARTWRDTVQSALETLGGEASLEMLYNEIEEDAKTKVNPNWQAQVRKVLQLGKDFVSRERGVWALA